MRRLPGGSRVLGSIRGLQSIIRGLLMACARPFRAIRHRLDPPLPPREPADWIALVSRPSEHDSFFCANSIAARCRYVFNFGCFTVNEDQQNNWYFCKTDYLDYFFAHYAPDTEFVLFSGHSDSPIGRRYKRYLGRPELKAWFAANVVLRHPKLIPMPVGMANPHPRWPNSDTRPLKRVQESSIAKTRLFHAAFKIDNNPRERRRCLRETGIELDPPRPFEEYVRELASAYFCISPRGKGIDCHRTWEALYLKTIPIVTRSALTVHHQDFPIVAPDDWSEFRSIDFSPELYERIWNDWKVEAISLDGYLRRVERKICELSGQPEVIAL